MNEIVWAERADDAAVADHLAGVITRPGRKSIAVPGGRTPLPILQKLAARELCGRGAEITLTDDRLVPEDHPASNYGVLRTALEGSGLHVSPLSLGDPTDLFDLVWIGMGADGHIASIFPACAEQLVAGRTAIRTRPDPLPPEAPFERVTLTIEALADTREMIVVIRGRDKRVVLEEALNGTNGLPISMLLARLNAPLTIYWTEQ